jgi:3-hydroxyisobutyrate dehydrogenase-like beta-hydroxyacid dehydrogenase
MNQNTKIAVLGLGAMGSRMALRWLEAGFEVIVWNRTPQKSEILKNENAKVAASPRDAAHRADVVVSMVRDNDASDQVWLIEGIGAIHGLKPGTIAIESSTLTPDWIIALSSRISETGVSFIEAPVFGTRPQAEAGQLIYLVGGDQSVLKKIKPLLAATSGAIHHIGDLGTAAAMKLAVNAMYGVQVAIWAEMLTLLDRQDIRPKTAVEILNTLPSTSPSMQMAGKLMAAKKYDPMFPIELVEKDFSYALKLAEDLIVKTPTLEAVRSVYAQAKAQGHGGDNIVGVAQLFERRPEK